ncbi:CRISPR-associated protein Csx20 [Desulfonema magnum]|uniref:Uncharacterized protein n=1 Tax=Desulfonema magnum TaxID=45655 RepID=A0A975BUV5_9BACT|nr:CRISPR-associated protein Csx20 [Desulfonema magnum]QTA92048.1 Uncharacterized protein dnm_081220 [Desulfonema magnum]
MTTSLFPVFNHQLTPEQESDARTSIGVGEIIALPPDLKELWGQIPPHLSELGDYLEPVKDWLASRAKAGDYVLIQGDFGACYIMVRFAFENRLIPVYATTKREAVEEHQEDGTVKMIHQFRHQIFRKYGK